ncbi:MAG: hypothetical protein ACK476_18970 [Fluviicola sp.]
MIKYFIYFLFVFLVNSTSAQEVVETSLSSCDNKSYPEYIRNRLIEKEIMNDTLFLNVGLVLNCCPNPIPKFTYRNDSLILEILDDSEMWCTCYCCFEMQIKVVGIIDTNFTLFQKIETSKQTEYSELKKLTNKYVFPSLKEINSTTQVNQTNKDGLKVGIWNMYYENSEVVKYKTLYSINSSNESEITWCVKYDIDGKISNVSSKMEIYESTYIEVEGDDYLEMMKDIP